MKKVWIAFIIAVILITVMMIKCNADLDKLNNTIQEKNQLIGQRIVIGKDTAVITAYSLLNDTYMTSKGIEISSQFVDKTLIITNK